MIVEMFDCERTVLRELKAKKITRRSVAMTYRLAMESSERNRVDWSKVNAAIVERWSLHALGWIKQQAWSGKCFEEPRGWMKR